eukprot:11802432-Alexandrium_andersonii.AAC.1
MALGRQRVVGRCGRMTDTAAKCGVDGNAGHAGRSAKTPLQLSSDARELHCSLKLFRCPPHGL